jgi:hypothetical protein
MIRRKCEEVSVSRVEPLETHYLSYLYSCSKALVVNESPTSFFFPSYMIMIPIFRSKVIEGHGKS